MNEIAILLVEDDFLNRRLIKKVLSERGYKILEAGNSDEALSILSTERVDLLVLDIKLGTNDREGVNLGAYIHDKYAIPFIYLTAYQTTDVLREALGTSPYSYLTKPFKNTDLIASVELALQKSVLRENDLPFLLLNDDKYKAKVPLGRIDYIESNGNYLSVYSNEKIYQLRSTIKQILEVLPQNKFVRSHRAYIVNKDKIDLFTSNNIIIKNRTVPVSKKYIEDIQAIFKLS